MIIKSIYKKIHISILVYVLGIISVITGLFKAFLIMYLILFIHELGHIIMAIIFKYNISKINIYPFGGYTIFDVDINKNSFAEFMVFFGGILFQFILSIIFKIYVDNSTYLYRTFNMYNINILLFNLLPIIPLDGSKVLNILFNKIFSFKMSHILSIYISYIGILLIFIINYKNLNMCIILFLLLNLIIKEHKNHIYIFNRFLIERYIKNIKFKKNNFIIGNTVKNMKKYMRNIFIIDNIYFSEKEVLEGRFNHLY